MGWTIARAQFAGTFIAKISRGRTIREYITATIIVPIFYVILWFSVFGSLGIKSYRFSLMADNTDCNAPKMSWEIFKNNLKTNWGKEIDLY